ncbi:MAG: polymer-forming cytoskeletal protein [Bacteroidetes bacterium]|nr:polymer-forming cytoskeletal protein [Bacteroidota bacterium]
MFNNKQEKKVAEEQLTSATNTIGNGTNIVGNIETFGNLRIDGKVKGNITTKNKLVLGDTSFIDGSVLAQNAEIYGEVSGCVEVSEILVLKSTARVIGDIITNKMIVESGAVFNGACKMGVEAKEIKINSRTDGSAKGEEAEPIQQTEEARSA